MKQILKIQKISHNGEKQTFLHRAYIDNTLTMKLLAEVKLNNNNIPCDPRRNQIIRTTQYGLCPSVPRVPEFPGLPYAPKCYVTCDHTIFIT